MAFDMLCTDHCGVQTKVRKRLPFVALMQGQME
jgi:hypothetical protein